MSMSSPTVSPIRVRQDATIGVVGCGYLGAVHAACLAHWGFNVVAVDVDPWKLDLLRSGAAPFYEDMLDPLLQEGNTAKKLSFTTDPSALQRCAVVFICVGTPQMSDSPAADLSQVNAAIDTCLDHCQPGTVIVGKSTVPVGTAALLAERLAVQELHLAWNPEFLREGTAVSDTLRPDRIVIGCGSDQVAAAVRFVYQSALSEGATWLRTDYATAEIIKEAANAYLATKVSFINAVASLCAATGADIEDVAHAMGLDPRIGNKFLRSGIGYGGGCFPKDVRALAHRSEELGATALAAMLHATDAANIDARARAFELVRAHVPQIANPRITVLGAAFKPGSDDVRDSPAMWLMEKLLGAYPTAHFRWHDPAFPSGTSLLGVSLDTSAGSAVEDADLVVVATDWAQYRSLDPSSCAPAHRTVVDLRNCIPIDTWVAAGWEVHPLGRPSRLPAPE